MKEFKTDNQMFLFYFASLYMESELYIKAQKIWKRYLKETPLDYEANYNLAICYQYEERYDKEVDLSVFKKDYRGAGVECCKLTNY